MYIYNQSWKSPKASTPGLSVFIATTGKYNIQFVYQPIYPVQRLVLNSIIHCMNFLVGDRHTRVVVVLVVVVVCCKRETQRERKRE